MVYDFATQLAIGKQAEAVLDLFFADKFLIAEATQAQERQGIDRLFLDRANNDVCTVQYKCDWKAGKTGNAFVETVSVDRQGKKGWAYTSQADRLIYYIPSDLLIYVIAFATLRKLYCGRIFGHRLGRY
jgi:hypothetical protein